MLRWAGPFGRQTDCRVGCRTLLNIACEVGPGAEGVDFGATAFEAGDSHAENDFDVLELGFQRGEGRAVAAVFFFPFVGCSVCFANCGDGGGAAFQCSAENFR